MTESTETGNPSCKVTIELPFNDSWEEEKVCRTLLADKWVSALWDVFQKCREHRKYDDKIDDHMDDILEEIQEIVVKTGYEEYWS